MSTSLMLVTALNPKIGYDNASKVRQRQYDSSVYSIISVRDVVDCRYTHTLH